MLSFTHLLLLLLALFVFTIGEGMRIYFGYYGNLLESVPHISTFLLLTFFPAIPAVIFFAFFQPIRQPFEEGASIIMLVFLVGFFFCDLFNENSTQPFGEMNDCSHTTFIFYTYVNLEDIGARNLLLRA